MRFSIWHRLFAAFATLSVLALAVLLFQQQRQFAKGFLEYVNRLNLEQLDSVAAGVADAYREAGGWAPLRADPDRLTRLMYGEAQDRPGGPDDRPHGDRRRPPLPPGEMGDHPPPPPKGENGPRGPRNADHDGAARPGRAGPPLKRPPPRELQNRVMLVDAGNQRIAGSTGIPLDSPSLSINVDGVVVGRLLMAPLPALRRSADVEFATAQARQTFIIAVALVMATLLLAWWIGRWLLKPIGELNAAMHALSAGEFEIRVPETRRDELGELARSFNRLAATLAHNRDLRRQWGADISHELRTPLAILRGEIQALIDGVAPFELPAMDSLNAECKRLSSLVEDLFQLSLSDSGALEYRLRPINLGDVVEEAVRSHEKAIAEAGLTLELKPLPAGILPVEGDELRLSQLMSNLLTNCRRYTDAPGRIVVAVRRDGSSWCVDVDDTPPGVPPASLPRLFDRLYRVEASRSRQMRGEHTSVGGAGLGLAIARSIVEAHSGTIVAGNSTLGGLAIRIRLPVYVGPA